MFGHLYKRVKPTEDSVRAMVDRELPELVARIIGESLEADLKKLCRGIDAPEPKATKIANQSLLLAPLL